MRFVKVVLKKVLLFVSVCRSMFPYLSVLVLLYPYSVCCILMNWAQVETTYLRLGLHQVG